MIKVDKAAAPEVLKSQGTAERDVLCAEYDANKQAYDAGEKTFKFKDSIFAHDSVRQSLLAAHHGKCCYCENKTRSLDVEHYRPKSGWRQAKRAKLVRPGYYWLAYEWDNLFVSCTFCNQRLKRNLFPLMEPKDRALSHADDLSREIPLLLNPSHDNPADHIEFQRSEAVPRTKSRKGATTIDVFGLTTMTSPRAAKSTCAS